MLLLIRGFHGAGVQPGINQMAYFSDNAPRSNAACPVRFELGLKSGKTPRVQGLANFAHQVHVVMQIVDAGQHGPEHFATAVQVVQISA